MRFLYNIKYVLCAVCISMLTTVAMASPYVIEGFRSAKFGMTKSQVVDAIKKDFKVSDAKIIRDTNIENGTDLLVVKQPSLSAFASPTTISYIFGYESKRLTTINVEIVNASKEANAQGSFLNTAINKLVPYFKENDLSAYKVIDSAALEKENVVVLFGLLPKSKTHPQALEIALSNVSVTQKDKQVIVDVKKDSEQPMVLRISYVKDLENIDIKEPVKIGKDDF